MATVLEDCVDQLAILGRIMPTSYEERHNADDVVDEDISQLVSGQQDLENKYEQVMSKKAEMRGEARSVVEKRADTRREAQNISGDLRNSTHVFARSLKQSPLTPDNVEKVQADR